MKIKNFQIKKQNISRILIGSNNKGKIREIRDLIPNKVKILSRHWSIYNSFGEIKKADGEGVIGLKPEINPGEEFKYKSFCPLNTNFGSMKGFYTLKDVDGNLSLDEFKEE